MPAAAIIALNANFVADKALYPDTLKWLKGDVRIGKSF